MSLSLYYAPVGVEFDDQDDDDDHDDEDDVQCSKVVYV
jgi:hypothetical protein